MHKDRGGFYATRIVLGMAEAITMPGLRCARLYCGAVSVDTSLVTCLRVIIGDTSSLVVLDVSC